MSREDARSVAVRYALGELGLCWANAADLGDCAT